MREALVHMRHDREKLAADDGNVEAASPREASPDVEAMAAAVVEFVTEGIARSDEDTMSPAQITTDPTVVRAAMKHQQRRAEV